MHRYTFQKSSAIIFENKKMNAFDIQAQMSRTVSLFNENAISIDKPIAIALDRSPKAIIVMLTAIEYGVPFLPIDLSLPIDRIKYIISDAKVDTIITSKSQAEAFGVHNVIFIEDAAESIEPTIKPETSELIYLLYTSGSTGTPKGVAVTRKGFYNFIDGISEIIDFSPQKVIACLTTVSFDIFFLESILALYKGLTVVLANENEQRNPRLMAKLIEDNKIDMIQMTPSRMQLLVNHDKELSCLKSVKEIMIGGEPFPLSLLKVLQNKTKAKIYNMYGPTEATIWSTVSDLTNKERTDIGRPIINTDIYIVDDSLYVIPNGQAGEICIAGAGLAKGYVERSDVTNASFIYLPQQPDTRVYRTGDVGRQLPDGEYEYLGRIDNQVKIRGHRVELEEIETCLNQFKDIEQSVVIIFETSETDKMLEAFYTSKKNIPSQDIANYLSQSLPEYMIPAIFKRVENFIQTANGKIDRKRVFECIEIKDDIVTSTDASSVEMSNIQKQALEVISSNLDTKVSSEVTIDLTFSSIGLDSITFIKIIVALESVFDFEFDDEMLLITKFPTIGTMIDYVQSKIEIKE